MKKNNKKHNKKSVLNVLIFFSIITLLAIAAIRKNHYMKTSDVCIGIVTRVGYSGGNRIGTKEFHYRFSFQDKIYSGYSTIPSGFKVKVGDSVRIRYSTVKPNISDVMFE